MRTHRNVRSAIAAAAVIVSACAPSTLVDAPPPSGIVDESQVLTPAGAMGMFNSSVADFTRMYASNNYPWMSFIASVGFVTDELTGGGNGGFGMNERYLAPISNGSDYSSTPTDALYNALHQARLTAQLSREALRTYAPDATPSQLAQLYSQEAYTLVFFAESFCNGIPTSSMDLAGHRNFTVGKTTIELFTMATALFDSALALSPDANQMNLARVGKGRALLGLGRQADAAASVQVVPTDFAFTIKYGELALRNQMSDRANMTLWRVEDNEGSTGPVWSADARSGVFSVPLVAGPMLFAAKYNVTATGTLDPTQARPATPIRLADGVEARLIEAEAALAANNASWLTTLNTLRATCVGTATCAPVPGIDTSEVPDTLTDRGSQAANLDLLMQERAMWLYLTGHRQGDLRRMVRVYQRPKDSLWPKGIVMNRTFPPLINYVNATNQPYGTDYVFVPEQREFKNNSLFSGCYDQNP